MRTDKALIFDFNGTLFWDSEYHRQAWNSVSMQYRKKPLSLEESHYLNGRTNAETITYLSGYLPGTAELERLSEEKELIYQHICMDNQPLHLAPGFLGLAARAKALGVPMAIATSAGKSNIERYKLWFGLCDIIDEDLIIYDDGVRKGKPEPDIYLDACRALGIEPALCTVFEDTRAGILSAKGAGIGSIWAVASPGSDRDTLQAMDGVHGLLEDFSYYPLQ
ncbi:MAG: HAD family hydrolase [Sphaerochaeta sp.]|uniref:HAD family hydrolase n=1 Tax=Sphaerochaeta sp. TaxID=1972642 RepID=UPI003D126BBF|nr:HAD family phosphatase [Sphaerochaeta sp.]